MMVAHIDVRDVDAGVPSSLSPKTVRLLREELRFDGLAYALADSDATTARIALYGRTPAALRALTDVLAGAATGGGTLPVGVRGVERSGCR
jgi:beta-glucosidase-like glycosyl hydrolase